MVADEASIDIAIKTSLTKLVENIKVQLGVLKTRIPFLKKFVWSISIHTVCISSEKKTARS